MKTTLRVENLIDSRPYLSLDTQINYRFRAIAANENLTRPHEIDLEKPERIGTKKYNVHTQMRLEDSR
ncbi:MAG TPA: hypothetical protein DDW52_13945 [Planctomycetaceae bacterium]|nr:hypothetical protein [Planctomycetaceae bacterium]